MTTKGNSPLTVAVIGATGAVGRTFVDYLGKSELYIREVILYASPRSEGLGMHFRDKFVAITPLTRDTVKKCDYAFFSAGASISGEYVPLFKDLGAVCIDNSSYYRMREDVPIIVPEVNRDKLSSHNGVISNPNCVVAGIVVAAAPLHRKYGIARIVASTYQAVSGAGQKGIFELRDRTRSYIFNDKLTKPDVFDKDILFNVLAKIPHKKEFLGSGYTEEEDKLKNEVPKIIGDNAIKVTATCVRVPVFTGHCVSLNIELRKNFSIDEIRTLLAGSEGLRYIDHDYATPKDAEGNEFVYASRLRLDDSRERSLWLWVATDNLRKGAAYNGFQIMSELAGVGR